MVVGRKHTGVAFRPSAPVGPVRAPSRSQLISLLVGLILVTSAITVASFAVKPSKARSFDLVYGSVLINDDASPVSIDLASGKPTVRLHNAYTAVSAERTGDLDVIGLAGGNTLMLNPSTGEFNMVDNTGFMVKTTGGGVRLPQSDDTTTSSAVPAGSSAYLLQSGASGTSIYLVGRATVSSAVGAHAKAMARAYATLHRPVADYPSPAVSGDQDLWLLTGSGSTHLITQLSVPPASNAGATLRERQHGSVAGAAALGVATRNSDGSGGDVMAVASASSVQIFSPTGAVERLPVTVPGTVERILAASNAQGRVIFLYQTSAGWSEVSAPTSPATSARVSPLPAIDASAQLVPPAESAGRLYTMERSGQGALWQIDASGEAQLVPGASHYPLLTGEKLDLTAAEVMARGNRVIFNARANYEAVVVFTDGSHDPRIADKHSAVQVDPSGAKQLADARGSSLTKPGATATSTSKPQPVQAINNKLECPTTSQTPHIPILLPGQRGSRSITLSWIYPVLENTDCIPQTYVVSVDVLTPDAPRTTSRVTVRGQTGVTLTHLFPATVYELGVTAYLNGRGTASRPIQVSTGPEGPPAPTAVRASTTASGNWTVSWTSCGGVSQGCVPSATWRIIPSFCDGLGLSGVPDPLTVAGDPTVHSFSQTYPGSEALLGRALCFQVQGISQQNTIGTASSPTGPAVSWSPPRASTLKLSASQPAAVALGGVASTSVDLFLGAHPVRDVGGVGATITFRLSGPTGTKTAAVSFDGTSDHVSTTFAGIGAGAQYTAQATVRPPSQGSAAVSTPVVPVTTRANWPTLSATANCPDNGGAVVLSCTLTVHLNGISSAAAGGERFTLADASGVVCGSTGFGLAKQDFDPANDVVTQNVDLLAYAGTCTVTLALIEGAESLDPQVFGGTTSPTVSTTVNLGQASILGATQQSFTADWNAHNGSSVLVSYAGGRTDAEVGQLADRWTEQLVAPGGASCGTSSAQPTSSGIFLDLSPASCVNQYGSQLGWQVTVSYFDRGTSTSHSFTYALNTKPPGYAPCSVSEANFSAGWASDPTVNITFNPDGAQVSGCSQWRYTVRDAAQNDCGDANQDPASFAIPVVSACTPADGFSVQIGYRDPAGNDHSLTPIPVGGTAPASPTPSSTPP